MIFSYNWLQSFFNEELPEPEKLAELLTMKSFEVENVEKEGNDWMLDIDILPNRAHDCLSHHGLARECSALLKFEILNPKFETNSKIKIQNKKILNVKIANKELVPRYTAFVIDDIEIKDSPQWIKERLAAMGQKSINNVVDITNYIMWELGQPLHAFDFDKIKGGEMTIRPSRTGEVLKTLDGAIHKLDDDTIIIEDKDRLIDLAGIKGGDNTQVDVNTKRVILQAAIFDSIRIRRSMQNLGARTDASVRYMHGFDLNGTLSALERAFGILQETSHDAKIVQKIDIYPNASKPKKVAFDTERASGLLGVSIKDKEMKRIFESLGFGVAHTRGKGKSAFQIEIPTYRLDIQIEEDLTEEFGRVYGYEKTGEEMPRSALIVPEKNEKIVWRRQTRNILIGMGFSEVYNYSLLPKNALASVKVEPIELANPISDEFRYLRPFLLPGAAKVVALNAKYEDSVKIFEVGQVFQKTEDGVAENEHLIIAMKQSADKKDEAGFYEMKGYVDEFFKKLGITNIYYDSDFSDSDEPHASMLHAGRRVNVRIESGNDTFFGFLGEVHPSITEAVGMRGRIFCAELDFEKISKEASSEHQYEPVSKYPEIVRDIAILVPRGVLVVDVLNAINSVSGSLLRDVDLFDMFEGENIRDGVKNLAFHLMFQSSERTLTAKEVDEIMAKIIKSLDEEDWEVR